LDVLQAVKWSPNSKMIACSMPRRNLIEILNVNSGEKVATMDAFLSGGGRCMWGPSSCILLVIEPYLVSTKYSILDYAMRVQLFTCFQMRALVWSLDEEACDIFNGLQPWAKPCVEFSPDGQWLALVQGNAIADQDSTNDDIKGDSVALISTITWRMSKVRNFFPSSSVFFFL